MLNLGKRNVLGVLVDAIDYEAAVDRIVGAARSGRPFAVSALAVHGVMVGVADPRYRYRLNSFDLITPDGQPVRWALNLLHRSALRETVCGSTLTRLVIERAAAEAIPVYLYGSREHVLARLVENLRTSAPRLIVAGAEPSKFRLVGSAEKDEIAARIKASGARLTLIGLGCPRQEVFAYELRDLLGMPILAVGAAFDYLAGLLPEPPAQVRRSGVEWLWRLALEPRRLWRRYLLLNPAYLGLFTLQLLRVWTPDPLGAAPARGAAVDA